MPIPAIVASAGTIAGTVNNIAGGVGDVIDSVGGLFNSDDGCSKSALGAEGAEYGFTPPQWCRIQHFHDSIRQRGIPNPVGVVHAGVTGSKDDPATADFIDTVAWQRYNAGKHIAPHLLDVYTGIWKKEGRLKEQSSSPTLASTFSSPGMIALVATVVIGGWLLLRK